MAGSRRAINEPPLLIANFTNGISFSFSQERELGGISKAPVRLDGDGLSVSRAPRAPARHLTPLSRRTSEGRRYQHQERWGGEGREGGA